jgi:hypothetical protein
LLFCHWPVIAMMLPRTGFEGCEPVLERTNALSNAFTSENVEDIPVYTLCYGLAQLLL